ncbi:MAG: phosphoribosylformylglycinamidine cyclo-ligase, partial [Planctomycetes bacterium]|nr:phosphoribosylformylglycinamidine cyclo-ligase [Planctomycetota bacterium]
MGNESNYSKAGVSLESADQLVSLIAAHVRKTHGPRVLHLPNGFAGMFRLDYDEKLFKKNYRNPVLVACSDGVGTKVQIAAQAAKYDTVGIDLVAMSVNDLLVQGAEPMFFLDYIAVNKIIPKQIEQMVAGVSEGCIQAECALLGGETAEMPGLYRKGEFDLAGFAVGIAQRHRLITGQHVEIGDSVIGLASNGLHSNGYSLVRHICFKQHNLPLDKTIESLGEPLVDALLRPTRIYAKAIMGLLKNYRVKKVVKAMAHITGGGLVGNIPRVIPNDTDVLIDRKWPIPPIFPYLQKMGKVSKKEMFQVFNMGIGYVLIVAPAFTRSGSNFCR